MREFRLNCVCHVGWARSDMSGHVQRIVAAVGWCCFSSGEDLRDLTLSDEETAAFEQDYDTEIQLAVDSIQQQLDTEEAGNRYSYNMPITEPVQMFVGKEASLEVGRMSIHLKDITKAVQNEPKSATVESGGARRDNIYEDVKDNRFVHLTAHPQQQIFL
ncbi:hypothetical protein NDU88_006275 [Pleurodeles waltl]|uniref:Uncharacterized protein n=1 Tax=Pleurodeles waltl TaxID=8319 RepID=A0AAV7WC19_PLEWA|nr:hypothetical protein NDU88_006275 [Pleurodeles waltl]